MAISFTVRIWNIRPLKRATKTTYQVRWVVGPENHTKTFATKALAESYRATLTSAMARGEAFDIASGLPVSLARSANNTTWYDLAVAFCDTKWKRWAPGSRAAAAEALATVTAVLVDSDHGPDVVERRHALEKWAFNKAARDGGEVPEAHVVAVGWLQEHSVSVGALTDAATVRRALEAISSKLDGSPAAATTANRKRMVFHQALEYAVERCHLEANPLDRVKWKAPKTSDSVDRRSVVNPTQARALITSVSEINGRMALFFALMYFAALRPAEAVALRLEDCELPEQGWGMLYLSRSIPMTGAEWTDSGEPHESRSLKHRAKEEVRPVPACPELVSWIRRHAKSYGTAPDGRLLRGTRGERLSEDSCGRVWRAARSATLDARQAASPLAKRPYDLRHAAVSTWLNAGVQPTLVAEWAGHSVQVLLRVYAKCIEGQDAQSRKLIEHALGAAETGAEPSSESTETVRRDETEQAPDE
ncbi:tyrosine-type recombinase/integrase [Actinospica robiniae]|uniref:tyrosine-type recombinase/integrase n=1 Tax=Actinospica robiniae TaxID=304901 RepID=UPI000400D978|nr:tyrosine-type recombinase/integrase [Actinospica robiniae]